MAFELLFNFIGNVGNLRTQLEQARQLSYATTNQQIADYRRLEDAALQVQETLSKATQRRIQAEKVLNDLQSQLNARLEKETELHGAAYNSSRRKTAVLEQQVKSAESLVNAEKQRIALQQQDIKNLETQQRLLSRLAVDTRRESTFRQQQLSGQIGQAGRDQQSFASAGFALAQSGNPLLQAVSTPLLAYGFGGPQGLAFAGIATAIGSIVNGMTDTVGLLGKAIKLGYEFSQEMETSRIAIAGIVAQTTNIVDKQSGQLVPSSQKFAAAMSIAKDVQEKLLAVTLRTNITLQEGNVAIANGLSQLTSRGVDPLRATNILVELASMAKSQGQSGELIGRQINSVFGNRQSILKRQLQQAGFDFNDLLTKQGDDLAQAFEKRLNFIGVAIDRTSQTVRTQLENVSDAAKFILGKAFEEVSPQISKSLADAVGVVFDNDKLTAQGEQIKTTFANLYREVADIIAKILTPQNVESALKGLTSIVSIVSQLGHMAVGTLGFDSLSSLISTVSNKLNAFQQSLKVNEGVSLATGGKGGVVAGFLTRFAGGAGQVEKIKALVERSSKNNLSDPQLEEVLKLYASVFDKNAPTIGPQGEAKEKAFTAAMEKIDSIVSSRHDATSDTKFGVTGKQLFPGITEAQFKKLNLNEIDHYISLIKQAQEEETLFAVAIGKTTNAQDALSKLETRREALLKAGDSAKQQKERQEELRAQTSELNNQTSELKEQLNALKGITQETSKGASEDQAGQKLKARVESAERKVKVLSASIGVDDLEEFATRATPTGAMRQDIHALSLQKAAQEAVVRLIEAQIALQQHLNAEMDKTALKVQKVQEKISLFKDHTALAAALPQHVEDSLQKLHESAVARQDSIIGISGEFRADQQFRKQVAAEQVQSSNIDDKISADIIHLQELKEQGVLLKQDTSAIDEEIKALESLRSQNLAVRNSILEQSNALSRLIEIRKQENQLTAQVAALQTRAAAEAERITFGIGAHVTHRNVPGVVADLNSIRIREQEAAAIDKVIAKEREELAELTAISLSKEQQLFQNLAEGKDTVELRNEIDAIHIKQQSITNEITKQTTEVDKLRDAWDNITKVLGTVNSSIDSLLHGLKLLPDNIHTPGDTGASQKLGGGINNLLGAFGKGGSFKGNLMQGLGAFTDILGGVGDSLQQGKQNGLGGFNVALDAVAGVAQMFGPVGQIVAGVIKGFQQIFGVFHALFSAAAQKMATDIKNQITLINNAFAAGTATLSQTIDALNTQRQRTFELEKKKGGKDAARQERAQLDQEIAQLQKQQREILNNFEITLGLQNLGKGYAQFGQSVADALKKVQDFVGAGGSLEQAQQFLSNTLKQLDQSLTTEVTQAQISALDRAKNLLDLERQRSEMINQNEAKLRSILSQGLQERELTIGERKSQALWDQTNQFTIQLSAIDDQINTNKALLAVESDLFKSGTDLNDLDAIRAQSIALQVANRKIEIEQLKQEQDIITNIIQKNGQFFMTPELFGKLQSAGVFTGQFTFNIQILMNGQTSNASLNSDTQNALLNFRDALLQDEFFRGRLRG